MFIVYDAGTETIYGTGETVQQAALDAQEWSGDTEIAPVHGVASSNAAWRWLEATAALVERVQLSGGDVQWYRNGNVADLS